MLQKLNASFVAEYVAIGCAAVMISLYHESPNFIFYQKNNFIGQNWIVLALLY